MCMPEGHGTSMCQRFPSTAEGQIAHADGRCLPVGGGMMHWQGSALLFNTTVSKAGAAFIARHKAVIRKPGLSLCA